MPPDWSRSMLAAACDRGSISVVRSVDMSMVTPKSRGGQAGGTLDAA